MRDKSVEHQGVNCEDKYVGDVDEDDPTDNVNYVIGDSDNEVGYQTSNDNDEDDELYHIYVDHEVQEKFREDDPLRGIDLYEWLVAEKDVHSDYATREELCNLKN